jgi:hypothetical protein
MTGNTGFSGVIGRNSLDLPVAALAGLAAGVGAFIVPPDLLADLVAATRLPDMLPAAQPPLGNTARIALGVAGALAVFLGVFTLLRFLDRMPKSRHAIKLGVPRVRKRDRHPDAPAPRPISASAEFGEPVEANVPVWLSPAELAGEEMELAGPATEKVSDIELEPEAMNAVIPEAEASSTIDRKLLASLDAPIFDAPSPARLRGESIAELMERLERGLARRQPVTEGPIRSKPVRKSQPAPRQEWDDDRLQSAIDSLQKFASRQM